MLKKTGAFLGLVGSILLIIYGVSALWIPVLKFLVPESYAKGTDNTLVLIGMFLLSIAMITVGWRTSKKCGTYLHKKE